MYDATHSLPEQTRNAARMPLPRLLTLLLALAALSGTLSAQDAPEAQREALERDLVTNAQIVELLRAQVPESTILVVIRKGPTRLDTRPEDLIALRDAGASEAVLAAVLETRDPRPDNPGESAGARQEPAPGMTAPGSDSAIPPNRVAILHGDHEIALKQAATTFRAGGGIPNPFSSKTKSAISGAASTIRVGNPRPVIEVSVPASVRAEDYARIVRLHAKKDRRELVTATARAWRVRQGVPEKNVVPADYALRRADQWYELYALTPSENLPPGEYAVAISGFLLYDFGID